MLVGFWGNNDLLYEKGFGLNSSAETYLCAKNVRLVRD